MPAGERASSRMLAALVAFYLIIVSGQGALKLVWGDELFTYYIARQPGLSGVWNALRLGADPNPPWMHLLVQVSTAAFGSSGLAIRMPAILCVLLALLSMWWMLRRWVRPAYALAGVLAFMATRGFDYAYDARSYAPMMGFGMASLAAWMYTRDAAGRRRIAAIAAMTLALAAGVSSNYYCVLAFFPIAAGEAWANRQQRRVRVGVWLGLSAGALPLFAYLPLIRHNIAEFGPHAWNRPQWSMVGLSYLELVEGVFWPVLALAVFAAWKRRSAWTMPPPETVAVAVLLIYPFVGFAIAVGGAGMISPRCVAPVCCGFGLAAGVLAQSVFERSRRAPGLAVLLMCLWVVAREGFCATQLWEQRQAFTRLRQRVADTGADQPILVGDSSFVLPFYFYSDPEVRSRVVFPVDFDAIHRFEQDDSGEQNLWAGRTGVFPFRIVPFSSVDLGLRGGQVVGRPDGWLAESLRKAGMDVALDPSEGGAATADWDRVGGVFTPLAHPASRLLTVRRTLDGKAMIQR